MPARTPNQGGPRGLMGFSQAGGSGNGATAVGTQPTQLNQTFRIYGVGYGAGDRNRAANYHGNRHYQEGELILSPNLRGQFRVGEQLRMPNGSIGTVRDFTSFLAPGRPTQNSIEMWSATRNNDMGRGRVSRVNGDAPRPPSTRPAAGGATANLASASGSSEFEGSIAGPSLAGGASATGASGAAGGNLLSNPGRETLVAGGGAPSALPGSAFNNYATASSNLFGEMSGGRPQPYHIGPPALASGAQAIVHNPGQASAQAFYNSTTGQWQRWNGNDFEVVAGPGASGSAGASGPDLFGGAGATIAGNNGASSGAFASLPLATSPAGGGGMSQVNSPTGYVSLGRTQAQIDAIMRQHTNSLVTGGWGGMAGVGQRAKGSTAGPGSFGGTGLGNAAYSDTAASYLGRASFAYTPDELGISPGGLSLGTARRNAAARTDLYNTLYPVAA